MKQAPKHIPKDILEKVLKLRKDMLINPKTYSLGKLAYDRSNDEFGFIIGPIKLEKDLKEGNSVERSLLVTIGEEGPRVRYTRAKYLATYDDTSEGVNDLDSVLRCDVFEFCNNLCIHECSDSCVLYKYKNNYENFDK